MSSRSYIDPADARKLRDPRAELAVLSGILRHPTATVPRLRETGIEKGDFYEWAHGELFDVLMSLASDATLVNAYIAAKIRGLLSKSGFEEFKQLLLRAWDGYTYWPDDVARWWNDDLDRMPFSTGIACAMAEKVKWMAARRHAIHAAAEQAQAAIDGILPPDFD